MKAFVLLLFSAISFVIAVLTSGGTPFGSVKALYRKSTTIQRLAAAFAIATGILGAIELYQSADSTINWVFRKIGPSEEQILASAIQSCRRDINIKCIGNGGAFGAEATLVALKNCKRPILFRSDHPALKWKDIWTTNIYSYQPGGGGPGGGRDDDVLKVGGWGDWYFSLIRFDLPPSQTKPAFVALALYSKDTEGVSEQLMVDLLIDEWDFPKGGVLWWRNRPGQRAAIVTPLPAPKRDFWYLIDITDLHTAWQSGYTKNYGLQLRPVHDFGSFVFFASGDTLNDNEKPRLIVC